MQTLIVFSHLRWDFVYQRPQHLLSRLAGIYRVLFVEEPVRSKQSNYLERIAPCANLEVLRPHTMVDATGFHDAQVPHLKLLLKEYLRDFEISDYIVWFYTPMALPLLSALRPESVIYDCMDELSAFKNAPSQLLQREADLLKRADLVLTGGPSLYDAKGGSHSNVHCFPSAVDAEHFAPRSDMKRFSPRFDTGQTIERTHWMDAEIRQEFSAPARETDCRYAEVESERVPSNVSRPRLGFFGVIDERFDIELLAALAEAAPGWQFVIAGPVVKIDPDSLPRHSNIQWLGQQGYEALPALVANWDVCLLPFALNASTRFISPTKTLEYMAAEKPVVSTPINDVIRLYGDAVSIAGTVDEFVAACSAALNQSASERRLLIERMRVHVARSSWDRTASEIVKQIEALSERTVVRAVAHVERKRRADANRPRYGNARTSERTLAESPASSGGST